MQAGTTPSAEEVAAARQLVGWQGIEVEPSRLALARRGMAVTLNGIAQGYITDRVAEMLRGAGMGNVLVSLGETRALGPHPEGRPWEIAPAEGADALPLSDGALATSEPGRAVAIFWIRALGSLAGWTSIA